MTAVDAPVAPLDLDELLSRRVRIETSYTDREVMLYALGVGYGRDPLDARELAFVYERSLKVLPSFATILAFPAKAITSADDFNFVKLVHGEHRLTLNRPLPSSATITAETRITDVIDKGEGKGAIILQQTIITDQATGERLAEVNGTGFYRGDGGRGGTGGQPPRPHALPDRAPDTTNAFATRPDQALLYRLSGDRNPLHSDPEFAARAGFQRPILHGLCTFGVACRGVLETFACDDPALIRSLDVRFSAPVFPGDEIVTELWRDQDVVSFRCRVPSRDVVVINNGKCLLD